MTKDEHIARAMLLDRVYDPMDHTYCISGFYEGDDFMLDADTLEVVPRGMGLVHIRMGLVAQGKLGPGITPEVMSSDT